MEKIVDKHSDGFEDALCEHWNKVNNGICPKGVDCTECLEIIIKTLGRRFKDSKNKTEVSKEQP